MRINQMEQTVGIPKKNIRFYEKEGLLNPGRNSENGYREYSEEDAQRLLQIKLLRKLAVPIGEIRAMQSDGMTLEDCLRRHLITLERNRQNLEQVRELCVMMAESGDTLSSLDSGNYLARMEQMEQEGVSFVNIQNHDRKSRYIAPLVAMSVMLVLMGAVAALFVWAFTVDPLPLGIAVFIMAIPAVVCVGVILACIQRIKEIKGGEEDAARKY